MSKKYLAGFDEYVEKLNDMVLAFDRVPLHWGNVEFLEEQNEMAWDDIVSVLEEERKVLEKARERRMK